VGKGIDRSARFVSTAYTHHGYLNDASMPGRASSFLLAESNHTVDPAAQFLGFRIRGSDLLVAQQDVMRFRINASDERSCGELSPDFRWRMA